MFRFLKAWYFPHISFLDAPLSRNVSYIWRSICDSRHVLRSGLRWRVGTGSNIKVWSDAWLQTPSTFKVISPVHILSAEATVDSLIDGNLMRWDVDTLELVFLPRDVEIIKQISLSIRRPCDQLIRTGQRMENSRLGVRIISSLMSLGVHWV